MRRRGVVLIMVCLTLSCQRQAAFVVPETSGMRWFKGNTHTHTTMSDGDSPPDVVAGWYKARGYRFLVLSDHNVFTDPAALSALVDSTFLLIPGEEVTATFQDKPVHVNGLNIPHLINPVSDTSLVGTIQKNVDAVCAADAAPHINHPNFRWAFSQGELLQINHNKLLEIFNGHPLVNNFGGGGWPGLEQVWDHLLTNGKEVYGIAVDDAHHFQGEFAPERSNPGRGWVAVRARHLQAREIIENLEKGMFYASTGVELDDIIVAPAQIEIRMTKRGDFKFRTEFIGSGGKILLYTEDNPAIYKLSGGEMYVRAKVYDSGGFVAWVQPVFVRR
jgi:predicted metal-dependent phosphoesterase TrpH